MEVPSSLPETVQDAGTMKPSHVFLSLALLMSLLGALCVFTGLNGPVEKGSMVQYVIMAMGGLCTCVAIGLFVAFGIKSGREKEAA